MPTVWRWQARFAGAGVDGLLRDKTRPPGREPLPPETVRKVAEARHWSARDAHGGWHRAVFRAEIWRDHGLKPHFVPQFELSTDPDFEDKLIDVVGLYLAPPDRDLVLPVNESSQIQALDRISRNCP